jgi:hypothetical protein
MGRHKTTIDPYYESKRRSYERNRESIIASSRRTKLGSGGVYWHGLNKRAYPGQCELCGAKQDSTLPGLKKLHYHHWDDLKPSMGIWLCGDCHRQAEGMDTALDHPAILTQYASIKTTIVRVFNESTLL